MMTTRNAGRRLAWIVAATSIFLVAFLIAACTSQPQEQAAHSMVTPFLETPVAARPAASADTVARGRQLYTENCVQCHGEQGDGEGFGAPFLVPPPRDFVAAQFKFRTTGSGQLPTDDDLFRIISRGANGTGMPPWQYLLPDADRWALVDYVKTFSPRFQSEQPQAVAITEAPGRSRDLTRGRAVYDKMQCAKCHGDDGRGMGPAALTLVDAKGRHVNTRDFTQPGSFRTGWTEREIIRTLATGNNGVSMPAYTSVMTPQEEYDLAAYIMSLAGTAPGNQKRETTRSMAGVGTPTRVIAVREHAWRFEPAEIRIRAGEVVRIDYSATDNGLGAGHGFAIDGFDQEVFINGAMVGAPKSVTFRIDQPGTYKFYCATQCSTKDLHPNMKGTLIVEAAPARTEPNHEN